MLKHLNIIYRVGDLVFWIWIGYKKKLMDILQLNYRIWDSQNPNVIIE